MSADSKPHSSVPPPAERVRLGITSTKRAHILDGLEALDSLIEQLETLRRGAEWEEEHGGCFCRPCNELIGGSNPASIPLDVAKKVMDGEW